MDVIKYKKRQKEIRKLINRTGIREVESNDQFYQFFDHLKDYFLNHNMIGLELFIQEGGFFIFQSRQNKNSSTKKCDAIKIYHKDLFNITLIPKRTGIELHKLEVYNKNKGLGTKMMNIINEISLTNGIEIFMIPGSPGLNETGDDKLRRKFYHRHGFQRRNTKDPFWSNGGIQMKIES